MKKALYLSVIAVLGTANIDMAYGEGADDLDANEQLAEQEKNTLVADDQLATPGKDAPVTEYSSEFTSVARDDIYQVDVDAEELVAQGIPEEIVDAASEEVRSEVARWFSSTEAVKADLSGKNLNSNDIKLVAEALRINTTVTSLNLGDNRIGAEGAKALADALLKNTKLKSLDLSNNYIGDEGAEALAEGLINNTGLIYLDLKFNFIYDEGAKALADAEKNKNKTFGPAMTIDLRGQKVDESGNPIFVEEDQAIVKNKLIAQGIPQGIIDAASPKVCSKVAKWFTSTKSVKADLSGRELSLGDVKLIAEALKVNRTLTSLDISNGSIGTEGVKAIAEALKINRTLTSLNISNSFINVEGAKAIAGILKVNRTLTSLNISNSFIDAEGVKAIAEALKANSIITSLDLSNSFIDAEGAKAIAEVTEKNKLIAQGIPQEIIDVASSKVRSEVARWFSSAKIVSANFNYLLSLDDIKLIAEALRANPNVQKLEFGLKSQLDIEGAKALADALTKNTTLTSLDLSKGSIGAEGVKEFAEALKVNRAITTLNISNSSIGAEGAKALAEALKVNSTITTLNISNNSIDTEGVKALAEALKVNKVLRVLVLGWNAVGDEGTKALAEALMCIYDEKESLQTGNQTLVELNLSNCDISDIGVKALADAIKYTYKDGKLMSGNQTLMDVEILGNPAIGDEGKKALADAMRRNTTNPIYLDDELMLDDSWDLEKSPSWGNISIISLDGSSDNESLHLSDSIIPLNNDESSRVEGR